MTNPIDSIDSNYSLAKKQMEGVVLRQKALMTNIANSQSPNYKRVDLDKTFEKQLISCLEQNDRVGFEATKPSLKTDLSGSCNTKGNNVEIDRELLYMNENNLRHQYLLRVEEDIIKKARSAITGNPIS